VSLRQEFGGEASGGLDALFASDPMEDRTGDAAGPRWVLEAAYGAPVLAGRWIGAPYAGVDLAPDARELSLGWRLTPEAARAPDLSLDLKAVRREDDATEPEQRVGVEITLRW